MKISFKMRMCVSLNLNYFQEHKEKENAYIPKLCFGLW